MKKLAIKTLFSSCCLALLLLFVSCDQAPLFFIISNEVKPKDPSVEGSPSKIIEISDMLYIANGNILRYNNNRWDKLLPKPNAPVRDIIAEGNTLYALTLSSTDSKTTLWRQSGEGWKAINNESSYSFLQSLYNCNGEIFMSGRHLGGSTYAILQLTGDKLTEIKTDSGWLSGTAYLNGYYYFATNSNGVYRGTSLDAAALEVVEKSDDYIITGLIGTDSEVIAVTTKGYLLELSTGVAVASKEAISNTVFTGALAIWEHKNRKLLLAGIHRSTGVYGYIEFVFNENGKVDIDHARAPGNDDGLTSVPSEKRYQCETSIGTHSISHLYVVESDDNEKLPVIFASTQKNGLYAFRNNEWNTEE
jgi:hypothetical protein